ncbi:MAG: proton-conducting transporter membrane subunit, partial [Desulfobulbaceae bacterium]
IIFVGMSTSVLTVALGPAMEEERPPEWQGETFLTVISPVVLLAAILVLGLYLPEELRTMFQEAADLIEVGP